ncbi:MAG: segregation and condensation protein A [Myxococcota bacterium]
MKEMEELVSESASSDSPRVPGDPVRSPVEVPKDYRPSESAGEPLFRVELTDFAGPLDLLLYLIRRHDVDVRDIPIKFITTRYLSFLEDLRSLQVDVASEFLVLAAELTHIKSKMLLPAREGVAVDDAEDESVEDPRAELVRRLLEVQKYRQAATQLDGRFQLGRDVFARVPPEQETRPEVAPGLKSVSIFRLVELMASMLDKAPPSTHQISFETYSITDKIQYVSSFGRSHGHKFNLQDLLLPIASRAELIVTFLAVLEMTKAGLVKLFIPGSDEEEATPEEDLPRVEVHLTDASFEGDWVDDYAGG